ncbi:hypothetical protein RSOL_424570 [Rhizoctonia solani AG-3 Rhs1AP]|uniref:HNH nuclease domain-containing protein n=2 Tax=Rhizoctonia solani AG-3 TaxID=1086053 RepID=A0A074RUH5_9AGAM|nr:hypothetical protein RSOL_424570 [Rhizoctonia solani AG-3 Rhs1AP]KEP48263.1 hypothetical protein V565_129260 [Rhizoctonia solani 123E]
MFATPLPPLDGHFENDQIAHSAYQRTLRLENQNVVWIRILGYMLIYAPHENGRLEIARDIHSCATDQDVLELGCSIFMYFVQYFKLVDTCTPGPPSPPSSDPLQGQTSNLIFATPATYSEAKANALVRDNYRCMLTGKVDTHTYTYSPRLREQLGNSPPPDVDDTECWHIIPHCAPNCIHDSEKKTTCAATFNLLERFGNINHLQLSQGGPHHWTNVMTVQLGLRQNFNLLHIWLDPVEGMEDTYAIGRRYPGLRPDLPQAITFTTSNPALPLPDRRYLALHAACARVAHLSGATETIGSISNEMEHRGVLSEDGSSAVLLEHFLSVHSARVA